MVKKINSKFSPNKSMLGVAAKGLMDFILLLDPVTKIRSKEELEEVGKSLRITGEEHETNKR